MPPNVMLLFSTIMPVVCYDLLEGWIDWDTQTNFVYTKSIEPLPGQLEELGYEGRNWVLNM